VSIIVKLVTNILSSGMKKRRFRSSKMLRRVEW